MCSRGVLVGKFHPAVWRLYWLVGKWSGLGVGGYPTLSSKFNYREETTIESFGKPFLSYQQKTWDADSNAPLHVETGYFRTPVGPGKDNCVELVVSDPTGVATIFEGIVDAGNKSLVLQTTSVAVTSTAKPVTQVLRKYEIDEAGELSCTLDMAAMEQPLQWHLSASLKQNLPIIPVTSETLQSYLTDEVVVVDVRTQKEYDAGHIANSILLPIAEFSDRLNELPKDKDVLLICRTARRSSIAAKTLLSSGFEKRVLELQDGLSAYPGQIDLV
eukprot:CAMPEP_0201489646 /NCGR_PEP_ID=MMETSP0151_2-20130828/23150_1 /ASSEMBLY_ACC=CAM_ASM_000257 /TAXON_ID=200890 /ORGANISM="Paramoeba atlantica, Strain 621/1 / CCAP 1560/9" /LENGTH=272 /DNA_ID=CAMNT_0047875305 /DNA_START=67 /DNA_END=885 /DNA_ORIENTATION=-